MANTLNVSQALKTPGQLFPFSLRIDVASADVFGETVRFSPAELTGTLLGAGETVTVRGEMRCEATMACARCLRPVAVPLRVAVDERFSRRPDSAGEDGETRVIEESRIDLTDCARELLILELPMRVLCSEDCKGLCPVCGANRNVFPPLAWRMGKALWRPTRPKVRSSPKKAASPERSQTPFRH